MLKYGHVGLGFLPLLSHPNLHLPKGAKLNPNSMFFLGDVIEIEKL
jgi:hypothetical protein